MPGDVIIRLEDVGKTYAMGAIEVHALRGINVSFAQGEYVSIMGPSGCGKSTLLNLLGCLDRPSSGRYELGGAELSRLDDDMLSEIRCARLGYVFQSYNLIPQLNIVENIGVPLYYQGRPERESLEIASAIADRVGLADRLHHRPYELSGGQQQRVAIARALVNDPLVILADEPTGNLDSASGAEILAIFDDLNQQGKTLIMVTHDEEIAERTMRVVRLRDGEVVSDVWN